jgi:hypothetical protein
MIRVSYDNYRNGKKSALMFISAIAICAFLFSGVKYISFFTRTDFNDLYHVGKWSLLHPGERIGMWQSGIAGFVAPNVINLDGKVNFDALYANRHGGIGSYIETRELDYLADWRGIADSLVFADAKYGGKFEKFDSIGRVIIFKREK